VAPAGLDQGFRAEHRLCKTDEFSSVFTFRRSLRGKFFELLSRPNQGASARLGIVAGKKFVRSAVARNLVKRIVRESFRCVRAGLPPSDLVVRVASRIEAPDRRALRAEIDGLLDRLSQLRQ
jgi:ribonuclease P protein component